MNPSKVPPHNIEAEQSLLCSFLLGSDPEEAVKLLDPEDFYKVAHQHIWDAIYSLYKNKDPIGSVEINNELKSMGKIEESGGAVYLAQLMDMPQAINIQHTSKIVKACSVRRKMIAVASQIEKRAYDDTIEAGNLVEVAKLGIESVISGDGFRHIKPRNLAQEIKDWVCLQEGSFCLQTVFNCLQLSSRDEKKNVSQILRRLSEGENKLITKNPKTAGAYKTVSKTARLVNLSDKSDLKGELPIKFPFGIESMIKPMPGCVYIIAGETDSGKSAFLMNFAKKNTPLFKVNYFSSETGKEEFLDRTNHFWPEIGTDKNFMFYEDCYDDYDLLVKPDDINIIDYLNVFDEFYLMAQKIEQIGRALNNGIAFVALQKPKGRDEGIGGEKTKNLSRLYLSLKPNFLKIAKAKNWRDPKFNPNNLEIEFKLVSGCKFTNTSAWRKP